MHFLLQSALLETARALPPTPPVDDLLRVYLGQTSYGSRAPEPDGCHPLPDVHDLWDYLGDFA